MSSTSTLTRPTPTLVPQRQPVVPDRRPSVPRPRHSRAQSVLWWVACLICAGLVGLVLAAAGTLRGRVPSRRRVAVVLAGTVVQLMCAISFTVVGATGEFRACAAPSAQAPGGANGDETAVGDAGLWGSHARGGQRAGVRGGPALRHGPGR